MRSVADLLVDYSQLHSLLTEIAVRGYASCHGDFCWIKNSQEQRDHRDMTVDLRLLERPDRARYMGCIDPSGLEPRSVRCAVVLTGVKSDLRVSDRRLVIRRAKWIAE